MTSADLNLEVPTLANLAHDLRQPLGAIEAIAYFLDLRLRPDQIDARRYVAQLHRLVAEANGCLDNALGLPRDSQQ